MQEKANENVNKQQQNASAANQSHKETLGEYIDFEEVK